MVVEGGVVVVGAREQETVGVFQPGLSVVSVVVKWARLSPPGPRTPGTLRMAGLLDGSPR